MGHDTLEPAMAFVYVYVMPDDSLVFREAGESRRAVQLFFGLAIFFA